MLPLFFVGLNLYALITFRSRTATATQLQSARIIVLLDGLGFTVFGLCSGAFCASQISSTLELLPWVVGFGCLAALGGFLMYKSMKLGRPRQSPAPEGTDEDGP